MPDLDPLSRDLLIRTVIGEADDQPPVGQAAVAHVALNRLASGKWGNSMPDVLFAKGQWEPWSTRSNELINIPRNSNRYQRTAQIVDGVLSGQIEDPTGGMTHFLEPNIVMGRYGRLPDWASGRGLRIGSHVFYAPNGRVMPQEEDYTSLWGAPAPSKSAPKGTVRTATEPEEEDLTSIWGAPKKGEPEVASPSPAPAPAAVASAAKSDHETIAEYINRVTRESHGHGSQDLSGLVTGAPRGDSWGDVAARAAAGIGRGVGDVGDTLAQGIAAGADVFGRNFLSPERSKAIADWRAGINADISRQNAEYEAAGPGGYGNIGRVAGEVAGTAPFLSAGAGALRALPGAPAAEAWLTQRPVRAAIATGAALGSGTNVLTSAREPDVPLSEQAAWGAGLGGALGPIGHGIGRLGELAADSEAARWARTAMEKYGIPIRADQISGNEMINRAGGLLQKIPGSGFGTNVAQQRGALNQALNAEMRTTGTRLTEDTLSNVRQETGDVFDRTLPNLQAYMNPNVTQRLNDMRDEVSRIVPEPEAKVINNLMNDVQGLFGKAAVARAMNPRVRNINAPAAVSGEEIQNFINRNSPLDRAIRNGSTNISNYASELKSVLLDAVGQSPTGRARTAAQYVENLRDYQDARYRWKVMKTLEPLVAKSRDGNISPAELRTRVMKEFPDMAYGGAGNMGEIAKIAYRFIKEPSTSGTYEHAILGHLGGAVAGSLAGAGLGAGAGAFDPENLGRDIALGAAGLGGARLLGAGLVSRGLARAAARSNPGGSRAGSALSYAIPAALAPRHNPLRLTVHPNSPSP